MLAGQMTGWLWWLLLVVGMREGCVLLCQWLGYPALANLLGMLFLLLLLLVWRRLRPLPADLVIVNQAVLRNSGLAFLPLCAGSGLLLAELGMAVIPLLAVMLMATLPALWLMARLAQRSLAVSDLNSPPPPAATPADPAA